MFYLLLFLSLLLGCLISNFNYILLIILILIFVIYCLFKFRYSIKKILTLISIFIVGLTLNLSLKSYGSNLDKISNQVFVVTKAKENYYIVSNYVSKFYVYEKNTEIDEGDLLKLSGNVEKINFTTLESSFDFENYLCKKGIFNKLNITYKKIILNNPFSKKDLSKSLLKNYNDDVKFILNSNFFAFKDYDNEYINSYKNMNFMNVLSTSGIFISFVFSSIYCILNLKLSENKSYLFSLILLFPFLLFNLYSFAITRLYIIFLIRFIIRLKYNRKIDKLKTYSLINIAFILLDPFILFSSEFIFINLASYLAFELKSLNYNILKGKYKNIFINNLIKKIIFYIFFLPLSINSTYSINLLSIIIQILLLPLFKINFLLGFFSLYLGYNPILNYSCKLFNIIVDTTYVKELNINIPGFDLNQLIIFYFLFIIFIYFLKLNYRKIINIFITLSIGLTLLYIFPIKNSFSSQISFINVGQGDAILIRNKLNTYLIDCGGLKYTDVATNSLIPYLRKNRIYYINTIFITHDDYDHCGSLNSLVKNYNVKNVITSKEYFPYRTSGLEFINLNEITSDNTNESSLILYLNIYNKKFLFMGDAPKSVEEEIIPNELIKNIDVLKIGHHGSNTSSSKKFLLYVNPKEAVISCGKNNFYGHPHGETINTLNELKINIRRTDEEGTITYFV